MNRYFTILIIFLIVFAKNIFSQSQLRFEHISVKEGLSNQKANCVFQDKKGFIWIGTSFGLNRYDGITCKTWYHDEKDSNSLVNNTVLNIAEDADGHLWIGTQEGVSKFNPLTERFLNYSAKGKGNFHFSKENCYCFIDKNGTVWVGSNKGASWLNAKENHFKDVPMELTRAGTARNLFATSFLHDSKNRLWISTSYGVKLIHPDKINSASFHIEETGSEKLAANACTQIIEDSKGRIFAGTWNGGILFFNEGKQRFYSKLISETGLGKTILSLSPFVENKIDYLWLGTINGLLKIKTADILTDAQIEISEWLPDVKNPESISNEEIYSITKDRTGILWIATASGVNKLDPMQQQFQAYFFDAERKNLQQPVALTGSFIDGEMYLATSNNIYKSVTGTPELIHIPSPAENITCIKKGKQFYWTGSFNGLWQFDKTLKPVKKWFAAGFKTPSGNARIKSVLEDSEGILWCGLWRGGILKFNLQTGKQDLLFADSSAEFNLSSFIINNIIEDSRHNIWFASNNGLYQFIKNENRFKKFVSGNSGINANVDAIESVTEGKDGRIWIGSRQGLRFFNYQSGKITPVDFNNSAVNDYISGIIEDEKGTLWLATTNGLLQYNPVTHHLKQFNSATGLQENNLTNLFDRDRNGNIYIGLAGALTFFNPLQIQKNETAFAPLITSVAVDNQKKEAAISSYDLKFNQSISIDFIALNFSNAQNNRYAYMIEGLDKEWKQLGNTHTLYFANLPHGKYHLKIKSANSDGVWNETPAEIKINVTPPFWKTWWFISLFVFVITTATYLFYRIRLQKAVEMERLRTRIATDLHDDIGATLSSISMYSAAVKEQVKEKLPQLEPVLNKMGENSREMVTSMSDIVWAINPGNDDGQKLVQRMEGYARDICAVKNVQLDFTGDKKLNELKLPLEYRKNIYLIFKEALNNALKYAAAETIFITAEKYGNEIRLLVKDNGKGFLTDAANKGNGLKNLNARAAEINGFITISSMTGEGTEIEFRCKV